MPSKKCPHGRQRSQCRECGGSQICEHNRLRSTCKECGGSQICEHGRHRYYCKECKGGGICLHGRNRAYGKECGGHGDGRYICVHKRVKAYCLECGGSQVCEHRRSLCSICKPGRVFKHYKNAALKRNYLFSLTLDEFKQIVSEPCFYCGESEDPRGVDRWDNGTGYEYGNCRSCCWICNHAKGTLSSPDFVEWIRRANAHIEAVQLAEDISIGLFRSDS